MYPKRIMPFLIAVFHHLMQVEDYAFWRRAEKFGDYRLFINHLFEFLYQKEKLVWIDE